MSLKIFLSDFDGTLVSRDILDIICGIVGKEEESRKLNQDFIAGKLEGLPTLKKRINFLRGVTVREIYKKLDENNYLLQGAKELFAFLNRHEIVTVLHSGNIIPVLLYYQNLLGISHIVGTKPCMKGDVIEGINIEDFGDRNFKLNGCKKLMSQYPLLSEEDIFSLGDSPADLPIFSISNISIAINPKGGIDNKVNFVIRNNLSEVIPIISKFLKDKY